jgi:L-ribulose-5-phosphate 3-epimerase
MAHAPRPSPIGIMQGRLSPPIGGRIQAFPAETWRDEFPKARAAGLTCIEWIHDPGEPQEDPLRSDAGVAEVRGLAERTGVAVASICADYFMTNRLVSRAGAPDPVNVRHLGWLVDRAGRLGARYVVLPFVDASRLATLGEIAALVAVLRAVVSAAEKAGVELHLETDLEPAMAAGLLEEVSHPLVRANYDVGNSAALGYDPALELSLLGARLGSVHVKDRLRGGSTVPLGTGAADFPTCFQLIVAAGFRGFFILQVAREDGIGEVELAVRNRRFVEAQLGAVGGG